MASATIYLRLRLLPPSPRLNRAAFTSLPTRLCPSSLPLLQSSRAQKSRLFPVVAVQSNFFKVVQTAWKVSKNVVETGTNFVPDSVPRPVARISVAVVAATVALFLLKSFLSTAFFVLAMMGLIYFVFISLNTDEGSRVGESTATTTTTTSTEESLEEARRIMEKYK
ncbi:uncharacterized protein [Typha angustifolia]|uniref:uncharacterized protein n=1 Tax=Typha angustifolia TaxID=59011 RepID=UPI003C2F6977